MSAAPLPEPTLGDPLSAVLKTSGIGLSDPPPDLDWQAQVEAAREISRRASWLMGVGEQEAFDALTWVPDNLLDLLRSPQGWSVLANFIAAELRVIGPGFAPTVH